eukprot:TRINITY_DN5574_c0_g3_i1.p1 TRINITY_DN5574_c0_g3~~TRINITY_DN5574_c0_g3_i1.p1  ORF type:complete len:336 (-),score=49.42 TRINITY_DN5574_c0_g3_i1:196-1158(-)
MQVKTNSFQYKFKCNHQVFPHQPKFHHLLTKKIKTKSEQQESTSPTVEKREDDVLPDNLLDAINQSADSTILALNQGRNKCTVEILLPQFWDPISGAVFSETGDQERWWKLTRRFLDAIVSKTDSKVKAVYPDIGVAAMLQNQWTDARFSISSLNDFNPVDKDDELVIIAAPDPQGLKDLMKMVQQNEENQSLQYVLFNPRLASGDIGIGLAARRIRDRFLTQFQVTYSLRPIGEIGTVFRKYPNMWQVFLADESMQGRYKLVAERPGRPAGDALELIVQEALSGGGGGKEGEEGQGLGFFESVGQTISSFSRFMNSLSK